MSEKVQEFTNINFLNTVRALTDSNETFVELMEMDGEERMQVMSMSPGLVTQADIDAARKRMASWKGRQAANS